MEFYTTYSQEEEFERIYKEKVKVKQDEIDVLKARTKVIPKFTAYAYIFQEPRVFCVREGKPITLKDQPTPLTQQEGGKRYFPDPTFTTKVQEFIEKHKNYDITFHVTCRYGPTVGYYNEGFPCLYKAVSGEELNVEDEDAYDILCG